MRAKLIVVGGKANREEIKLKLPTIVGRSRQAGVCIAHPMVSRQHCELYEENGKIYVRDLGSLNGTLVADSQVQRFCLEHGDTLTIGPLTFQVVYEHLGAIPTPPAKAPKADEDSAIGQVDPPELAQTMVDMPRVGAAPVEDLSPPPADLADDDGFDLGISAAEEEFLPTVEVPVLVDQEDSSIESLKLFAGEEEEHAPEPELAMTQELLVPETPAADTELAELGPAPDTEAVDELGFDLSPPEELAPEAAPAADVAEDEDEFLAFLSDQPEAPASPAVTEDQAEVHGDAAIDEAVAFDLDDAIAAASVAEPAASDNSEDELDWLQSDAPAGTDTVESWDDLAETSAMETGEFTPQEVVEELEFDDAAETIALPAMEATPQVEKPVAETPAPVAKETKKKRGLWPFGRKKQPAVEPVVEAPAAPLEFEPTEESIASDETVVMEMLDLTMGEDHAVEEIPAVDGDVAEAVVDLTLTQELAHERTVVIEDVLPSVVETVVAEAPEASKKPKRGLFSFGKKKSKEPPAEDAAEVAATEPEGEPAAEIAATTDEAAVAIEESPAQGAKKRGWWPFGKKGRTAPVEAVAATEAVEPTPAAKPATLTPAVASPNPESFEFSEDELLEITAENEPNPFPAASDPQALAADETLDFELDLPLHDSSASIEPVLSDAPPPTTGADDDDFLDFLSEELPGAKSKRGAG